jgi:hypothetical protein
MTDSSYLWRDGTWQPWPEPPDPVLKWWKLAAVLGAIAVSLSATFVGAIFWVALFNDPLPPPNTLEADLAVCNADLLEAQTALVSCRCR